MLEYGKRRTCNICSKSLFKKFMGDVSYDISVLDDNNYDNDIDIGWVKVNDTIDVCPECINKMKKLFKKEEEDAREML